MNMIMMFSLHRLISGSLRWEVSLS